MNEIRKSLIVIILLLNFYNSFCQTEQLIDYGNIDNKSNNNISESKNCSISTVPAIINGELKICKGTTVNLTAIYQEISNPTYLWEFGDGNFEMGETVSYSYDSTAFYNTRLKIIDGANTCETFLKVLVSSGPKINNLSTDISIYLGEIYNLSADTVQGETLKIDNYSLTGFTNLINDSLISILDAVENVGTEIIIPFFFSQFSDTETLNDVNLISIFANMEHSYFGDLEVELICPNGNNIHIVNGYSSATFNNEAYLGEPIDYQEYEGIPAVGYNYYWTQDIQNFLTMEDFNVPTYSYMDILGNYYLNHTYFPTGTYLPYNNMTSLLGCPLNGEWKILITDNLSQDNGFIFNCGIKIDNIELDTFYNYSSKIVTYEWTGNDIIGGTDKSIFIKPESSGIKPYTFSCTDDFGCSDSIDVIVNVLNNNNFYVDDVFTCDTVYTLNAGIGFLSYNWTNSEGNIISNQQSVMLDSSGVYGVLVEIELGLFYFDSVNVVLNDIEYNAPIIENPICEGASVIIDAGEGYEGYNWYLNDILVSEQRFYQILQSGEYLISVQTETGCYSEDSLNVVVLEDNSYPVPYIENLPDIFEECGYVITDYYTATDYCVGLITGVPSESSFTNQGNHTITWTYNDGNGNITTQTQNVYIFDILSPVPNISNLPDYNVQCSLTVTNFPTAIDNCLGVITGVPDQTFFDTFGNHIITWTYDDGNGNITTQTQNVYIYDNIPPVPNISNLPDYYVQCSFTVANFPEATDNCSGLITGVPDQTFFYNGNNTITWTYDDGNENISTQTQNVYIFDNILPSIDCIDNITINLLENETSYTVIGTEFDLLNSSDNCEIVSIANNYNSNQSLSDAIFEIGETIVVWTVTDFGENTTDCSFVITVNEFVGISDIETRISIYPNPTTGNFTVKFNNFEFQQFNNLILTDISGRVIQQIPININQVTIDLANLSAGIYFVKINTGTEIFVSKIVKE